MFLISQILISNDQANVYFAFGRLKTIAINQLDPLRANDSRGSNNSFTTWRYYCSMQLDIKITCELENWIRGIWKDSFVRISCRSAGLLLYESSWIVEYGIDPRKLGGCTWNLKKSFHGLQGDMKFDKNLTMMIRMTGGVGGPQRWRSPVGPYKVLWCRRLPWWKVETLTW